MSEQSTEGHDPISDKYETPQTVVDDPDLSVEEKIRLLQAWERNARQMQVAEGEGLAASEEEGEGNAEALQGVSQALKDLGVESDADEAQSDITGSAAS